MNLSPEQRAGLVKDLGRLMHEYSLTKVSLVENTSSQEKICNEIILERGSEAVFLDAATQPAVASISVSSENKSLPNINKADSVASTNSEIKSPIVGVFYSSSSPETDPFVRIGDTVKKGDVLCILEAMKLMNEIQAEQDCTIMDICVQNGDVVEFGQILFKVSPL